MLPEQITPLQGGRVYDADAVDRYVAHLEQQLADTRNEVEATGAELVAGARGEAEANLAEARREIGQLLADLAEAIDLVLGRTGQPDDSEG